MLKRSILLSALLLTTANCLAMNGKGRNDTENEAIGKASALWWKAAAKAAKNKKTRDAAGKTIKAASESCTIL